MQEVISRLIYWLARYNAIGGMGKIKLIVEFENKDDFCQAEHGFRREWESRPFDRTILGIEVQFRTRPTHDS